MKFCIILGAHLLGSILLLAIVRPAAAEDPAKFIIEVEGGAVWQSRNDVQIPNDETGTRFSLTDVVGHGPWPAGKDRLDGIGSQIVKTLYH